MRKSEVMDMIKEEIHNFLKETDREAYRMALHGTEESQRVWVLKLAKRNGGILSLSIIADNLNIPRNMLNKFGYIKRMYNDATNPNPDFRKVIEGEPFKGGSVYQLITEPPLSKEELLAAKQQEQALYGKTQGEFYIISMSPNVNRAMPPVCFLNIMKDENPQTYFDMIPPADKKDYFLSKKPMKMAPNETQTKMAPIVGKDEWPEFIKTNMQTSEE